MFDWCKPLALGVAVATFGVPTALAQNTATKAQDATETADKATNAEEENSVLDIGSMMPKLEHVTWLKGKKIDSFEPGHIYVLDFWATWCGPCIASIPHLNETAKKYADDNVHVIGVAIWPRGGQDPEATKNFVEDKGDGMSYLIAEDIDGKTADAYMKAAGRNGIPTVMIVDRSGQLAFIGHPRGGMDEALEGIVDGTFDIEEAKEAMAEEKRKEEHAQEAYKKAEPILVKLQQAIQLQDWESVLTSFEELIEMDEEVFGRFRFQQYMILMTEMSEFKRGKAMVSEIMASDLREDPETMFNLAFVNSNDEGKIPEEHRDLDLAKEAATAAADATEWESPHPIAMLARAHFLQGDRVKALEYQRKAIELAKDNEQLKSVLEESLKEMEEAKEDA